MITDKKVTSYIRKNIGDLNLPMIFTRGQFYPTANATYRSLHLQVIATFLPKKVIFPKDFVPENVINKRIMQILERSK